MKNIEKQLGPLLLRAALVALLIISPKSNAADLYYGSVLCHQASYTCFTVPKGETWQSLFPEETQRDLIMRINRMGVQLHSNMVIAVPQNLNETNLLAFSPFDKKITGTGQKHIIANPTVLAWGAYDENGNLIKWGPASMGRDFCPDTGHGCHTKIGEFNVYQKGGGKCFSSKFPAPTGGAPMPYCMYFSGGYALHGSDEIMGFNASHGCVRMLTEDAEWLNHHFVSVGTPVTILPYKNDGTNE